MSPLRRAGLLTLRCYLVLESKGHKTVRGPCRSPPPTRWCDTRGTAGMISEANQVALQAAGLSFILGARIPHPPDVVREWRDKHPDQAIPIGWC